MAKKKSTLGDLFEDDLDEERAIVSTGLKLVDPQLGGGLPQGVLGEFLGPTGSGKTSLAYTHIAEQQKLGNVSVLVDVECSWGNAMGARYGIDKHHTNKNGERTFYVTQNPELGIIEHLFARLKVFLYEHPEVTFIAVDSLAALSPQKATEKKAGDQTNTDALERARLFSFYMRELRRWIADTGQTCTIVFINHEREVVGMGGYGPPKKDSGGGKALKFYATFRLQFAQVKTGKLKTYDPVTQQEFNSESKLYIRVQALKNRLYPPFRPATFIFDVGEGKGIDTVGTVLAHAEAQKVFKKETGGRFTIPPEWTHDGKEAKVHGMPKLYAYYEEHLAVLSKLEDHLAANLGKSAPVARPAEGMDDNMSDMTDLT